MCCQNHSHTLNVGAHTGSHTNKTVWWTTTTKTTTRQHGSVRCISASCAHTVILTWTLWQAVQLCQPEIAQRGTGEVTTGNWSRHATQQSTSSLNDTRRRPIFKRARLRRSGTEIREQTKRGFSSRRVAVSTSLDTNQRLNIVPESGIAWRKTSQLPGWHEGCTAAETEGNSFYLYEELNKYMNE